MGLYNDFHEVFAKWSKCSWLLKLWLALSLFLASGSIASLSDTVFKWKGFVLDGISFYRRFITAPIEHWLSTVLNTHLPINFGDVVALTVLVQASFLRVYISRWGLSLIVFVPPIIWTILLIDFGLNQHTKYAGLIMALALLFGFVSTFYVFWRIGGAARIAAIAYYLGPFLLVGLFGAISSGLFR